MERMNKEPEKELDLIDLIRICGSFVIKIVSTLLKVGLKKWYILLGSVLLGVALSIIIPNYVIKRNRSEVFINNNASTSTRFISEIEAISALSRDTLSKMFDLDKEVVNSLISIRAHRVLVYDKKYINTRVDKEDEYYKLEEGVLVHPNFFTVEMVSTDISSLEKLNISLLNYLNYNSQFTEINTNRIKALKKELNAYKHEVAMLDSIRVKKYLSSESNQQMNYGGASEFFFARGGDDDENIKNSIIELNNKIIRIEGILENDTLAVEQGSTIKLTSTYLDGYAKTLIIYVAVCFALAYILIFLYSYKNEISEWFYSNK